MKPLILKMFLRQLRHKGFFIGIDMKVVLLALCFILTPLYGGVFNPQTLTLKNGLQVILIKNTLAPVVRVSVCYKVGVADDPENEVGISHFLEHMMFKGTKKYPQNTFTKTILEYGGRTDAYTTYDLTAYVTDIAVEHLGLVLELEADRMVNLDITKDSVVSEKKVVQEERRMRLDNHPFGSALEAIDRALFWYHRYGIPAVGYPHHIQAYSDESLLLHYQTWYAPNNAVLIIAGDFDEGTIKELITKQFEKIPMKNIPSRQRATEPFHAGITGEIIQEHPRFQNTTVLYFYQAPNFKKGYTPDFNSKYFHALTLLDEILLGKETSRFYKVLVDQKHLALSASSEYNGASIDPHTLMLQFVLVPNVNVEDFLKALGEEINNVKSGQITEDELSRAKRNLIAGIAFARDGNASSVGTFEKVAHGFSIEDIENWPEEINAVTLEQVKDATKKLFSQPPAVIAKLYPEGKRPKFDAHLYMQALDEESAGSLWERMKKKLCDQLCH